MSDLKVTGTVYYIGPVETRGAKNFQTRTLVLETTDNPKYPQLIAFEFSGKNIDKPDAVLVGDEAVISYNLRGREWTGQNPRKFFVSLDAWKIDTTRAERPAPSGQSPGGHVGGGPGSNDQNDIPFLDCTNLDNTPPRMWRRNP